MKEKIKVITDEKHNKLYSIILQFKTYQLLNINNYKIIYFPKCDFTYPPLGFPEDPPSSTIVISNGMSIALAVRSAHWISSNSKTSLR